jgi:hypothetical protein
LKRFEKEGLPSDAKFQEATNAHNEAKAERKKNRESKSRKKEGRHSNKSSSSLGSASASSSEENEIEWKEKSAISSLKRDPWMLAPPVAIPESVERTQTALPKSEDNATLEASFAAKAGHTKSLRKEQISTIPSALIGNRESSNESSTIGKDNSRTWRARQLKRLNEQADREGRSIDEIALERWGSLSYLRALVAEFEDESIAKAQETASESGKETNTPIHLKTDHGGPIQMPMEDHRPILETTTQPYQAIEKSKAPVMTEKELNQLAAKMLRAECMGDLETKSRLEHQLNIEKARAQSAIRVSSKQLHVSDGFSVLMQFWFPYSFLYKLVGGESRRWRCFTN